MLRTNHVFNLTHYNTALLYVFIVNNACPCELSVYIYALILCLRLLLRLVERRSETVLIGLKKFPGSYFESMAKSYFRRVNVYHFQFQLSYRSVLEGRTRIRVSGTKWREEYLRLRETG
jgi:hypothetical protein